MEPKHLSITTDGSMKAKDHSTRGGKIPHIWDEISESYGAPPIYRYSQLEKSKICLDDEDFLKYIKRNFRSLKGWDEEVEKEVLKTKPMYR